MEVRYTLNYLNAYLNRFKYIFFHFKANVELEAARNFLEQAAVHDLVNFISLNFYIFFVFIFNLNLFQPTLLRQLSDILRNTAHNELTRAQAGKILEI